MNENQFWMVYIEGDGIIDGTEYDTFNDAKLAAEEFLGLPRHRGQKAYILSATCYSTREHRSVVWHHYCGAATEEEK